MPDDREPAPRAEDAPAAAPSGATAPAEPGAPVPRDALDPELINLRPRRQVGILTAAAVVVFCAHLGYRLRHDLAFAGEPSTPRPTTVAEVLAGRVGAESHVAIAGDVERAATVRITEGRGWYGLRVAPALGGGDRVWFALDGDGWIEPRAGEPLAGRLRRLSALPFDAPLRRYWREHPVARFVSGAELRARGAAAGGELTAVTGDGFTARGQDLVTLERVDPDAVTLVGPLGSELADGAAWAAQLAAAGLVAAGATPTRADAREVAFEVARGGILGAAREAQRGAGLPGLRVEPRTLALRAPLAELGLAPDALTIAGARVPWAEVDVVRLDTPRPLAGDPWVVVADEHPGDYWHVRPLFAALAGFGLLFAWALVRGVRSARATPPPPAAA